VPFARDRERIGDEREVTRSRIKVQQAASLRRSACDQIHTRPIPREIKENSPRDLLSRKAASRWLIDGCTFILLLKASSLVEARMMVERLRERGKPGKNVAGSDAGQNQMPGGRPVIRAHRL
jgi:hypothetical protein